MADPLVDALAGRQDPMAALQKAQSIGPMRAGSTPLLTLAEQSNPIRKLLALAGGADPFGLGQNGGPSVAMLGGIPEGLNPAAIEEVLRRDGIHVADDLGRMAHPPVASPTAGLSSLPLQKAKLNLDPQMAREFAAQQVQKYLSMLK